MTAYRNPIGANPFLALPPVVYVVRNVRVTPAGETIAEDPNRLPRMIFRLDYHRTYPQPVEPRRFERNVPDLGQRKVDF
jgi:hypothetical protein